MYTETQTVTTSRAIPIINNKTFISDSNKEEYCLKQHCFDPNKSSPPNNWTSRLLERIEIFSGKPINVTNKSMYII
jgi:hypothetical protein